jgi:hypothetical protein
MSDTATAPTPQPAEETPPKLRHINAIKMDLAKRLPDDMLKTREQGGKSITYIPWYHATRMLDRHAPGWSSAILATQVIGDSFVITMRLTIPTIDGPVSFEATGIEELKHKGYGDFASNASSMALRRCAAQAGLGRYLYYTK